MNFVNRSGLPAAWTVGFRRDGRELLVTIVKATFNLPAPGEPVALMPEQQPLVQADEFSGEPGFSAPKFESDYAPFKPGCDVLLVGSAYAPRGTRVKRCEVELRVGAMSKRIVAVGPRVWQKTLGMVSATSPTAFETVPLSYDTAWGGTDRTHEAEGNVDTFVENPVGRGYWRYKDAIDGQPLPYTEQAGKPIDSYSGNYVPQAFSPLGRSWTPRAQLAGTYDKEWLTNRAPLWPDDFNERYFQCAAADQIISYPVGGEQVMLRNLSPHEVLSFALPVIEMPVTFIPHKGRDITRSANVDTIVLQPDQARFTLTWRHALPLGRSIFDVKETIVGQMSEAWHRSRRFTGKPYYTSLRDAVKARAARKSRT